MRLKWNYTSESYSSISKCNLYSNQYWEAIIFERLNNYSKETVACLLLAVQYQWLSIQCGYYNDLTYIVAAIVLICAIQ